MRKVWIGLGIVALLAVGFALAYAWQARNALKKAHENRKLLGGVVGAVEDAGSLFDNVKTIFGNLKGS
jgi:hypothetical protein